MKLNSTSLDRRDFFKLAGAITAVAALHTSQASASTDSATAPSAGLIDVNVYLSRWPTRRPALDEPAALVNALRAHGVERAWAGSFDALLHKDIAAANAQLADDCRRFGSGVLVPFGSVNPKLPDWEEELNRCTQAHHMTGIRLHPNYHGYRLDDPTFEVLLRLCVERRLIVQIALAMEDERMMHPLMRVPIVNTSPLLRLVRKISDLRLVLLNATGALRGSVLRELTAAGEVHLEIAMLEGVGGIENLLADVPVNRILFGSYSPYFYFESSLLKMKESELTEDQSRAIRRDNAIRLLKV